MGHRKVKEQQRWDGAIMMACRKTSCSYHKQ